MPSPGCMQAGAITGFVSAFVEGPIDFFKSQIQVQIIRAKSNPDYKRARRPPCMRRLLVISFLRGNAWWFCAVRHAQNCLVCLAGR